MLAYDRHRHCGQGHCAETGINASGYDDGVQLAAMDVEKIDALHSRGLRLSADLSDRRVGEDRPNRSRLDNYGYPLPQAGAHPDHHDAIPAPGSRAPERAGVPQGRAESLSGTAKVTSVHPGLGH